MSTGLVLVTLLYGLSHGLLLFMLAGGLTAIYSMMGVLNFAHASFYMLGAYVGHQVGQTCGFWVALVLAPLLVGLAGAAIERYGLRRLQRRGPVAELLFTFGLSYVIVELVQLIWGRAPLPVQLPPSLQGRLFTVGGYDFPAARAFAMVVPVLMLGVLWLALERSRTGLVIRAALSHPQAVEALGHDLPALRTRVFGLGTALAALAGVVGGAVFVTQPSMAAEVGTLLFVVVVVGGLGSLAGSFVAALLIGVGEGCAQLFDATLHDLLLELGYTLPAVGTSTGLLDLSPARLAPLLPYAALVLVLLARPRGLMGRRLD